MNTENFESWAWETYTGRPSPGRNSDYDRAQVVAYLTGWATRELNGVDMQGAVAADIVQDYLADRLAKWINRLRRDYPDAGASDVWKLVREDFQYFLRHRREAFLAAPPRCLSEQFATVGTGADEQASDAALLTSDAALIPDDGVWPSAAVWTEMQGEAIHRLLRLLMDDVERGHLTASEAVEAFFWAAGGKRVAFPRRAKTLRALIEAYCRRLPHLSDRQIAAALGLEESKAGLINKIRNSPSRPSRSSLDEAVALREEALQGIRR